MCHSILYVGQRTWMELPPAIHVQGKHKQWRSPVPLVLGGSLRSWRAIMVPDFLCVVPLICCAGDIQLAQSCLSLGIALNIGVHLMCSWEG